MSESKGVVSIAIVCEGPADKPTACDLADRIIATALSQPLEAFMPQREYRGVRRHDAFLAWTDVKALAKEARIRMHGHFDNQGVREQAREDAQTARKALVLLERSKNRPDAVILLRDSDGHADRIRGLDQARNDDEYPFKIVIGVAH
jgi:hypothetical protein